MKWIKDRDFIRGNIPMTKFNIRILTMAYLAVEKDDIFLDIGAGTGSVAVEAALQGAVVYAIEREEEGIELMKLNGDKFGAKLNIIHGQAPGDLPELKFNKCFIGGSGGRLEEIFLYLDKNMKDKGILCANFITLKNLNRFIELLEKYGYKDIELDLVQVSSMDEMGLLKGQNPIFIVKGVKYND